MFKLSRKGWNNVIIVVVLIVITLLHRLEQAQQENSAQRSRPLLPPSTWLTLSQEQYRDLLRPTP